jgi:hypothetical protein
LYDFFLPHTYLLYGFVCQRNLYKLVSSAFGNNIRTCIYFSEILQLRMVTSYELVYFRLSTIQIPPNEIVHYVTVRIHSSSTHTKEEARDEEQDDEEEEDVVSDEVSGGLTAQPLSPFRREQNLCFLVNIYVGIVGYFLRKTKTRRAKIYLPTQRTNRQILYDIN